MPTLMSHPVYDGPPLQPCCGKRHPLPFAHRDRGEILCGRCKQGCSPSRRGSMFCKPCAAAMGLS